MDVERLIGGIVFTSISIVGIIGCFRNVDHKKRRKRRERYCNWIERNYWVSIFGGIWFLIGGLVFIVKGIIKLGHDETWGVSDILTGGFAICLGSIPLLHPKEVAKKTADYRRPYIESVEEATGCAWVALIFFLSLGVYLIYLGLTGNPQ